MAWFRKKPVAVEMLQWNGVIFDCDESPAWLREAIDKGMIERGQEGDLLVKTPEGTVTCVPTDWVGLHDGGALFVTTDKALTECYDRAELTA